MRARRSTAGITLFLVLVIDSAVNGLFVPLSMLYLSTSSGTSLIEVGALLSIAGLLSLPLPLWIGPLVDRHGPKPIVLVAQLLQAAGFLGYLISGNVGMILVAATLVSLGQRAFWSSAFTLVSNLSDRDPGAHSRERWFGIIGSLRAAGYGVGAIVAGLVLTANTGPVYREMIGVCACLLLAACLLLGRGVPGKSAGVPVQGRRDGPGSAKRGRGGYRVLWADRPYLAFMGLNTVFALCNVMLSIAFPLFIFRQLPAMTWLVGPLLGMNTVVQVVLQGPVVRLIRPLPRHKSLCLVGVLWASWACLTAAPLWIPSVLWVPCLVVAVVCYSGAQLVHSPVSNALSADAAPEDIRGRYLAVFQYSFAIAGVAAPLLFSLLSAISSTAPWAVLAVLALMTVPGMLILARHLPQHALTGSDLQAKLRPLRDSALDRTPPS
ncbi:MFS transporter [Arthrobacter sp. GAS37]|uniref:MFS transporter n=1 Tax=Arthrobacter sp. GAS37 TaxID=3156261 RepID=UPI00384DBF2D